MNGTSLVGWFKDDGSNLHGYGRDSTKNNDPGLYEEGVLMANKYEIAGYSYRDNQKDIIAENIDNFDDLFLISKD